MRFPGKISYAASVSETTGDLLFGTARRLRRELGAALLEADVTPSQARALRHVVESGSMRPSVLAERLHIAARSATEVVDQIRAGQPVRPTRGAQLGTWRQAERVLAGFPDGKADEGVAAVGPSLLGLTIAQDNGWSAPPVAMPRCSACPCRTGSPM